MQDREERHPITHYHAFKRRERMEVSKGGRSLLRGTRRAAGIRPGDVVLTRVVGPGTVEVKRLPTLPLAELLARYQIDGPINEPRDRERWEDAAAEDVISSTNG